MKSSSLVTMQASRSRAYAQISRSDLRSIPRSPTCSASWPPTPANAQAQAVSSHLQEISRFGSRENGVIRCPRRKFERRGNVVIFQIGIIAQDFFARRASREHIEDVLDPDTQPSNAGAPATGFRIDSYAVQHASHD